jgi:hypothetical protein
MSIRDVASGLGVLRDERIEPIGGEARSVVACESGGGKRSCQCQQRHDQKLSFHDALQKSPDLLRTKQSEGVAGDYVALSRI